MATEPLVATGLIATGGLLVWFGTHYWRDQQTLYPTDVVKSVLQGKGLPTPSPESSVVEATDTALATAPAIPTGVTGGAGGGPSLENVTPVPDTGTVPQLAANTGVGTGTNAEAWATGILDAVGAPLNTANLESMIAWFSAESAGASQGGEATGVGENNPLDVTGDVSGVTGSTGSEPSGAGAGHPGNLNFPTPAAGIAATVVALEQYPDILSALQSGAGLIGNTSVSSELSTWSGGGYSSLK
jgi:hypothetical protein